MVTNVKEERQQSAVIKQGTVSVWMEAIVNSSKTYKLLKDLQQIKSRAEQEALVWPSWE